MKTAMIRPKKKFFLLKKQIGYIGWCVLWYV